MTTIPFTPRSIKAPEDARLTLQDIQTRINRLRMAQSQKTCSFDPAFTDVSAVPPPPYEDVPHPKNVNSVASFDLNTLATSKDIVNLQKQANAYADSVRSSLDLRNMTVKQALRDVYEATFGVIRDVYRNDGHVPLVPLLTKNNRMRGFGFLFVVLALLAMI